MDCSCYTASCKMHMPLQPDPLVSMQEDIIAYAGISYIFSLNKDKELVK